MKESAVKSEEVARAQAGSGIMDFQGEKFYRIDGVDKMKPFLMNLVSSTDHWMFIGSNGTLTAGRRNADNALFPYCTQDKLFESLGTTGGITKIWLRRADWQNGYLWEPFSAGENGGRSLYKNVSGTRVIFEELQRDFELRFRCEYSFSESFGIVRKVTLENLSGESLKTRVLDGIQNLVPYGLDQAFTNQFSNLADAYKKSELLRDSGIGIYYLSSIPTDKAEPSEGLKASIAWSPDGNPENLLLCSEQISDFVRDGKLLSETDIRARRGAYLLEKVVDLEAGAEESWHILADVEKDAGEIVSLRRKLSSGEIGPDLIDREVLANRDGVRAKVASADGLHCTGDPLRDARHFSNTMFNIMRGGVFDAGYEIDMHSFLLHLEKCNKALWKRYESEFEKLESGLPVSEFLTVVGKKRDLDLSRLANEFLPLTFSRRHGDPSRPWNKFSIDTLDANRQPVLAYQGNWRDIFQNWEPLAYSYPSYLDGMISKFLNASTADGYNPYRISNLGFDWETIDPAEAWSNIGYWGDHQLAYLLKLLEASERYNPGGLAKRFEPFEHVYAHVPYRIRRFDQILQDPRNTVDFDEDASVRLLRAAEEEGADGKLLRKSDGAIVRANFLEKLLTPLLAKLSNFVPDGGIWMNTQRPEWNDANNALVGYGVSVVTLCYAHRYLEFLKTVLEGLPEGVELTVDRQIGELLRSQLDIFSRFEPNLRDGFTSEARFRFVEALGRSGEDYREAVYEGGLGSDRVPLPIKTLDEYLDQALRYARQSILRNQRPEGLFNSYNLLQISEGKLGIDRLQLMLEGQVAALSSGVLCDQDTILLLNSLRKSQLWREDVASYLLYPDRELPTFLEKNLIPDEYIRGDSALSRLLDAGLGGIVYRDESGDCRFNGQFRNAEDLKSALKSLESEKGLSLGISEVLEVYERVFDHRRFTGRSGTFFAYEGLGSVYWHMVSKLVLAIQENCFKSVGKSRAPLAEAYFETLDGLGLERAPQEYGAFPTDAYSHTPAHALAQQPGMTGQVKEDVLVRWGELGIVVEDGRIRIRPKLLRKNQFLGSDSRFEYLDVSGRWNELELKSGELGLSLCQTPIVMRMGDSERCRITRADGAILECENGVVPEAESRAVFERSGDVLLIEFEVSIPTLL
ncbi:hypothetical protein [Pelagicoccus albus]|uniref:Cellobiose phosphorylase n=1 Tax=Pelagicoccus albus TaxID=415222 RepID=A0A7X1EA15_9BACT|nr:hypothetical protein [Pelagicoccus albus]MBC2606337.1 hypothetical protein [Pelagicoccus albus]